MQLKETSLKGVRVISFDISSDSRGSFQRLYCKESLRPFVKNKDIVQVNYSQTQQIGAVRGLHFQRPPAAEFKLVRCLQGKVFDVVVDLRKNSPTFLNWHAEELSPKLGKMLIIPEGCAHGFQVLEPAELLYLHTATYQQEYEGGILFNDPMINIQWPLSCSEISDRDKSFLKLDETFKGIEL